MESVLDYPVRLIGNACFWVQDLASQVCALFTRRPFRVVVLSLAIAAMSCVDLYLTLLYVTNIGMNEMNPLARAMMEYQSPAILAAWKMGTVMLSIGILILIRKQRSAEIGAWIGCMVLGWLMVHWVGFINVHQTLDMELAQNQQDASWIMITTGDEGVGSMLPTVID